MCVSLRRNHFVVKVTDVGKSKIIWSGKNRCHMFKEIIKFRVA